MVAGEGVRGAVAVGATVVGETVLGAVVVVVLGGVVVVVLGAVVVGETVRGTVLGVRAAVATPRRFHQSQNTADPTNATTAASAMNTLVARRMYDVISPTKIIR